MHSTSLHLSLLDQWMMMRCGCISKLVFLSIHVCVRLLSAALNSDLEVMALISSGREFQVLPIVAVTERSDKVVLPWRRYR